MINMTLHMYSDMYMKLLAIDSWQYAKVCDILLVKMCDMPNKNSLGCKKRARPSKVESIVL